MELTTTSSLPLTVNAGTAGSIQHEAAVSLDRIFSFKITNATGADAVVYLNPSYAPPAGAKILADGAIVTNLTGTSLGDRTIAEFLEWIKWHPTRVFKLQISTDTSSQLDVTLNIQKKNLFGDPQIEKVLLSSFKSPNNFNDKLIIIEKPDWQLDNDTQVYLTIAGVGGTTNTTFQFYCGSYLDNPGSLRKAARLGH